MPTTIEKSLFGRLPDGSDVDIYTLKNSNGLTCNVATYGGIITKLLVPDRNGKLGDIVLGYDTLVNYLKGTSYVGAIIGRVANRITKARFSLNGQIYKLAANDGVNHLHGGERGFDKVIWNAQGIRKNGDPALRLSYTSCDGDEGYPGKLEVAVTYSLNDTNELSLDYEARTDKPTPVSLTNHTYWNLAGLGDVLDHELTLSSENYTPCDKDWIPTGEIRPVKNTPMDFTFSNKIGSRFGQLMEKPPGYNYNYVSKGNSNESNARQPTLTAHVCEPVSSRVLELWSDQSGLQFYTGTFLTGSPVGKGGAIYKPYSGFCLEPQNFPDAINHPNFPSSVLLPGETYRQTMICKFSVR